MTDVDLELLGIGLKYNPNDGWQGFRDFLVKNHAIVFPPLNENEIYRASTRLGMLVGQKSKIGRPYHPKAALDLIDMWEKRASPPSLSPTVTRRAPWDSAALAIVALINRDGPECFYCGEEVRHPYHPDPKKKPATRDHFLPRSKGGPNNLHNYVLACENCNLKAGSMNIVEKSKFRDYKRGHRDKISDREKKLPGLLHYVG